MGIVYLMYHELELPGRRLCEGFTGHHRYAVPRSEFQREIRHLKSRNWRGMSVSEALADSKTAQPGVVITFDDGSETDLIGAAPLLKESSFNASFYIVVGWLGKRGYLSQSQLRELADFGFEIGCHSMTHPNLNEIPPTQLHVEIAEAKQKLEDLLGRRVDHFSAPGGFWSRKLAQMAMEAGYRSVATSRPGVNQRLTDPFNLARVVVLRSTALDDLESLCMGKQLVARRTREAVLHVPKRLLGYSKYLKFHSLFSANVDDSSRASRGAATSDWKGGPVEHGTRACRVLMIDYNVGDGGSAYEVMVAESLGRTFELTRFTLDFRKWGLLKYVAAPLEFIGLRRILATCPDHAVTVKTLSAGWLNPARQAPSIVILHHIGASDNAVYSALERHILRELPKARAVVVVSEYWRRYLLRLGLTNIYKIHNAFEMQEFAITTEEIEAFKRRYDLLGRPIIYMGNYSGSSKGVEETFEASKDLDVHLVASGHKRRRSRLRCFFFGRRDYLRLLAASSLAITMSQFAEGWCRTAHEAMLCGTPVVGSGLGGLGELLQSGGQIVCKDFCSLRASVEALLGDEERRSELGRKGREFASQFTYERFQAEWVGLVNKFRAA